MVPQPTQHHHRSTTKTNQKPFKSRHASKSALKEQSKGKVDSLERGSRKTPHQQVMSKIDRRNQAKQKRAIHHQEHEKVASVFTGKDAAPRMVAVIPLCANLSSAAAVRKLNASVDVEEEVPEAGLVRVGVQRFKQKLEYVVVERDLVGGMDAARAADYVVFILSPEAEVDEYGELMLRSIESQGISNTLAVVQGLDSIEPPKKRPQIISSLKSYITHFLPTIEKVSSLDSTNDCANIVRSLCNTLPKGIRWREERSWMVVEDVQWAKGKGVANTGNNVSNVTLTGVVRGKGLKADRLVQVGDWGDYQIEKITAAPLEIKRKGKEESMAVDEEQVLEEPSEDQDDLGNLAPEEVIMDDMENYTASVAPSERKGVLLDDHRYFEDEEKEEELKKTKKLPRGTSGYQSAWYLADEDYSGSDMESVDEDMEDDDAGNGSFNPEDHMQDNDMDDAPALTEAGPSEYPQSEMFVDPSPEDEEEQIAAYRTNRRNDAEDDAEFPDEVELPPNVLARERLARYRGLKSLKTSVWDLEEDRPHEPEEWRRLLEISDYKGAKNRVLNEALVGGVQPGTRVHVQIRSVPTEWQQRHNPARPLCLFSLLRHEHKRTSLNYSISLSSEYPTPLKSKTELIVQCGPRRFLINPLFSQAGNTPNDVHKFDRYLHPGRSAIASFMGPVTWGSVPVLFFQRTLPNAQPSTADPDIMTDTPTSTTKPQLNLIATGTHLAPSTSRIIAKRIILTGHPYKIHKRLVTIRYMFFNQEDVAWFKALQLWTKRGRTGYIKESLGTHGYFKATFDGGMNAMDSVGMSLYKRVWPRMARCWAPDMLEEPLSTGVEEEEAHTID